MTTKELAAPELDAQLLYALLKIDRFASYEQIQRSYKLLSKTFHPDRLRSVQDKQDAQKSFLLVKQAHEILSDPILRLSYDYGGLLAVNLVKRSQQRHHHDDDDDDDNAAGVRNSKEDDTEDDSEEELDLYRSMQRASRQQAVLILQEALDEHLHDKQAGSPHFDASLGMPFALYQERTLERDATSINFHCKSQPTPHVTATVGASSQIQRTAESDIQLSSSLSYQPAVGSQVQVDASMSHHQPAPQLSVRTQRQFSTGTMASVIVGGNCSSWNTLSYTATSFRNLTWRHNESSSSSQQQHQEPTRLQAFWRLSLGVTGRLQFAMAQVRTIHFPQWRIRLASTALPLKISWQNDSRESLYIAWSTAGMWSRFKIMAATQVGRWKLQYGIKYDGGGAVQHSGGMPVSVLCKLQSSDWTIRIPIGVMEPSSWPVVWLSTVMVSLFVEGQLDKLTARRDTTRSVPTTPFASGSPFLSQATTTGNGGKGTPYDDMIGRIAAKKKQFELAQNGLVILRAEHQDKDDVADFLQYWVVDGRLYLSMQDMKWCTRGDPKPAESAWDWAVRKLTGSKLVTAGLLDSKLSVRYRHGDGVYDIVFEGDELIWLPNDRARKLGSADIVQ